MSSNSNENEKKPVEVAEMDELDLGDYDIILQLLGTMNFRTGQSVLVAKVEQIVEKIKKKFPQQPQILTPPGQSKT